MLRTVVPLSSAKAASRSFLRLQSSYLLVRSAACLSTVSASSNLVGLAEPRISARSSFVVSSRGTCRFQSTWAASSTQRRSSSRSSRPVVNGKPVAFHVKDLLPTGPAASSYSSSLQLQPEYSTKKQYDSDLIVLLDMDECLIHSQFLSSPAAAQVYAHQLQQQRRQQHTAATASTPPADSFRVTLPDGDLVHVHVRPGLHDFLQHVTARYETHIFTAAMPIYANPVLDQLEVSAGASFAARWFRQHCTYDAHAAAYVKNLHRLPAALPLQRVVLVDNNPLSFLANPANGILVNSFYTDPADNTLLAVQQLLTELEELPDVRPALEQRFALHDTLQDVLRTNVNQVKPPQYHQRPAAATAVTAA